MEEDSRRRNHRGIWEHLGGNWEASGILGETPTRHPGGPRRRPGNNQEPPRRHAGGTQRPPGDTQEALRGTWEAPRGSQRARVIIAVKFAKP